MADKRTVNDLLVEWGLNESSVMSFYHETDKKNVSAIKSKGLKRPGGVNPIRWYMVTNTLKGAKQYRGEMKDHVIIQFNIPKEEVDEYIYTKYGATWEDGKQFGIKQTIPGRYIYKVIN